MGRPNAEMVYLPTLDGWRALAILAVIVSHAKGTLIASGFGSGRILNVASHGRLGVDLFFAISGFLICHRLLDEFQWKGRVSLSGFYLRRSFRILPLYFTYLVMLTGLALLAGLPVSQQEIVSCVLFYRNYATPPEGGYTNHFWSLAVEEHFYLLWPISLVLLTPRRALWAAPILALCVQGWRALDVRLHLFATIFSDSGVVFRTDTRIDAILWGCFAALVYFKYPKMRLPAWASWATLCLLLMGIVLPLPALPLLLAVLFPILVVSTVTCPKSALSIFLEIRPLRWVGRLSYSLYVWQTLFLQETVSPDPAWLTRLKWWPLNIVMIFIFSVLGHYLIERPMIRVGRVVARRFASIQSHTKDRRTSSCTTENLVGVC